MGAAASVQNDDQLDGVFLCDAQVLVKGTLVSKKWEKMKISLKDHMLDASEVDGDRKYVEISLEKNPQIIIRESNEHMKQDIEIRQGDSMLCLDFATQEETDLWLQRFQEELMKANASVMDGTSNGLHRILDLLATVKADDSSAEDDTAVEAAPTSNTKTSAVIPPPCMNIVILVVGTRGDIQPFVYLGKALQKQGHTVRVATHAEYRKDVIKEGLLYYPLGGDPFKLSSYMVKTQGRLMPDLLNEEERRDLPEKMKMLKEITYSTWPACTAPDPEDPDSIPFVADAIISNPISYGHIHCAEALAVPLPWYPTRQFPHPLANLSYDNKWSLKNKLSFTMMDEFMWLAMGSMINTFRREVLLIPPIRPGEGGDSLLLDHKVPISHMWSEAFVPRCIDWPSHVDVVGEFSESNASTATDYDADSRLVEFINQSIASTGDKPIYIGFGSMVINDASKLKNIVMEAAADVKCFVILQSGWTKYGENYDLLADNIMIVGPIPHSWLFHQVSGVIHHGGAGTTSAGLRAGNPTFICPFFGDQHFWAEMVCRAGVGPRGCPIGNLTSTILSEAFRTMQAASTRDKVRILQDKMSREDGIATGIASFYRNLPLEDMLCEVSLFEKRSRIASVFCKDCGLKMCKEVDEVMHRVGGKKEKHFRMSYRCVKWGVTQPSSLIEGLGKGLGAAAYEVAGGFYDLVAKPIQGGIEGGAKGVAKGIAEGFSSFVARPIRGGGVLVDYVTKSVSNQQHRRNRTVEDTMQQGSRKERAKFSAALRDLFTSSSEKEEKASSKKENDIIEDSNEEEKDASENTLNDAIAKALRFRDMWMKMDASGDRFLSLAELEQYMPTQEAKALLETADINKDGELTFAELAIKILNYGEY